MQVRTQWRCELELDSAERVVSGGYAALCDAIRRGADLRVYTEFYFEEHIAPDLSPYARIGNDGLIRETIDFRQTFLVHDRHAAGVTTTRQPMFPVLGFNGKAPRLSLFLYNMTGHQACATLPFDTTPDDPLAEAGRAVFPTPEAMPKLGETEVFDVGSSSMSRNFTYHMETYRFWVRDDWSEVYAHDENGRVIRGSFDALVDAQRSGREIKAAVQGLCGEIGDGPDEELFCQLGSGFTHTRMSLYESQTHPVVRVKPSIPLGYSSNGWDLTWLILRTNGTVAGRTLAPRTMRFHDWKGRFPCRWFVR